MRHKWLKVHPNYVRISSFIKYGTFQFILQEAVESEQVAMSRSWLQECCISLSPSNDTLAVAKNDKAVFLTSKWLPL